MEFMELLKRKSKSLNVVRVESKPCPPKSSTCTLCCHLGRKKTGAGHVLLRSQVAKPLPRGRELRAVTGADCGSQGCASEMSTLVQYVHATCLNKTKKKTRSDD